MSTGARAGLWLAGVALALVIALVLTDPATGRADGAGDRLGPETRRRGRDR